MEARELVKDPKLADNGIQQQRVSKPLIDSNELYRHDRWYWIGRRLQDVVLSFLALCALWPALILIALVIWIDSPGASPFFVQTRVGRKGRLFRLFKFRTMIPRAEEKLAELIALNEMNGPVFKIKDDPRITRVGRFLRRSSIDELPQLINVLLGDMSIVGPRPALQREVEQYNEYEKQRLIVQPGLTCYWQIQPHRNELSFEEWMDLDMKYIRERSFWIDWKIIIKTVGAVFGMTGE